MIETQRLVLRKPASNDLDIIGEVLSCPVQTRFLPNEAPYSPAQQLSYLQNRIIHWKERGFGTLIVCMLDDPETKLGFVGAECAPNPEFVDIRFGMAKKYEGKGYTTEAATGLIKWLFRHTDVPKLYGVAMRDNAASKAVLQKLGMSGDSDVDLYNAEGLDHYSLPASDM